MIPARVALALQADGWTLRRDMPWLKRAAMPESANDRPNTAHEYVFMLSKSPRYYFDMQAIKKSQSSNTHTRGTAWKDLGFKIADAGSGIKNNRSFQASMADLPPDAGRNFRSNDLWLDSLDVHIDRLRGELAQMEAWRRDGGPVTDGEGIVALDVNPEPTPEAHFATFASALITPLILCSTSERGCCRKCQAPWVRVVERESAPPEVFTERHAPTDEFVRHGQRVDGVMRGSGQKLQDWRDAHPPQTTGWSPGCQCADAGEPRPCVVLDPFAGSGTTLRVAERLGRRSVGIELQPEYVKIAEKRTAQRSLELWGASRGGE